MKAADSSPVNYKPFAYIVSVHVLSFFEDVGVQTFGPTTTITIGSSNTCQYEEIWTKKTYMRSAPEHCFLPLRSP